MNLDTLPGHLIIVGASYIGLEFAQMYARFGAKVTVIERGAAPGLARGRRYLRLPSAAILEAEGVTFLFNTTVEAVAKAGHGVLLSLKIGRAPRLDRRHAICWWPWAARPTRPTSTSPPPASRPMSAASSRSMTTCAPRSRASGPWATSMAAAPSPTPPTTTSRSSPTMSSMAASARSAAAFRSMASSSIRRSAASA